MKTITKFGVVSLSLFILGLAPIGAAVAQVRVTAATPPSASQGTIALDVVVNGNGFDRTAQVDYFVTGTTNPGGITVRKVVFRSSKELVTTIDVAETAVLNYFDIHVTLQSGRKGKGTTLFSVTAKPTKPDSYTGENLGTLPNHKYSAAWDVNDSGHTVGRSHSSVIKAFYWNGTMRELPGSAAGRDTPPFNVDWDIEATGISNGPNEIAVGYEQRFYCDSRNGPCHFHQYPVFWQGDLSQGPDARRLDDAAGAAQGINRSGSMAVGWGANSAGAFWARNGSGWIRGDVPLSAFVCEACEYESGSASDVNDDGMIVGITDRKESYLQFAYFYDTQAAVGTILPIPPGYLQSYAYAIGNVTDGKVHITGGARPCSDDSCEGDRAIRWTVDTGTLVASSEILDGMTWAEGVTDQGSVAGTQNTPTKGRGNILQTAMLWKSAEGYISLKPASGGTDSASRSMATGSDGSVFVVGETNSKGTWTAVRWVIP